MVLRAAVKSLGKSLGKRARKSAVHPASRDKRWAQPVAGIVGTRNMHRVSDTLLRGGQPTAEGLRSLAAMGVRAVVSLRTYHSDRRRARKLGISYYRLASRAYNARGLDAAQFLAIVTDPDKQPVYVHCLHGSDRTGTMVAVYRMVIDGWSRDDALREMIDGGFGFFPGWRLLVRYVEELDIEPLRERFAGSSRG